MEIFPLINVRLTPSNISASANQNADYETYAFEYNIHVYIRQCTVSKLVSVLHCMKIVLTVNKSPKTQPTSLTTLD